MNTFVQFINKLAYQWLFCCTSVVYCWYFVFLSWLISTIICTIAFQALTFPRKLRRARDGFQEPPNQLVAVELAVIRWSLISPPSIPRGTEQPATRGLGLVKTQKYCSSDTLYFTLHYPCMYLYTSLHLFTYRHLCWYLLTIKLTTVHLHADRGSVIPVVWVESNVASNQRREQYLLFHTISIIVSWEILQNR